jgi:hypothetical protein
LKKGSLGAPRSWLDRNWNVSRDKVEASALHRHIVSLDFPIIYTTNYDRNLEVAFEIHGKKFVKVSNARDVAHALEDVTQIIKFHGDFDDDGSLDLNETYYDRLSFDSPLDIKFRADALGRTILFVGYSLSDLNIRLLLHRLWQTWNRSGYAKDRPQPFVFMAPRTQRHGFLGRPYEQKLQDQRSPLITSLEAVAKWRWTLAVQRFRDDLLGPRTGDGNESVTAAIFWLKTEPAGRKFRCTNIPARHR